MIAATSQVGTAASGTPLPPTASREYLRCYLRCRGLSVREAELVLYDVLETPDRAFLSRQLSMTVGSISVYRRRIYQKLALGNWQDVQQYMLQLILQSSDSLTTYHSATC